ncbi:hypothetical protein BGZ83_007667 [Gryganskiella cystojenkinii]|nr:hypothetical protein BGZ83_007667 [Gryganskiella cystojenkinii]
MNPPPSSPSSSSPNLAYKDGVFLSTHKFLGGPGASGILVARLEVFSWTEEHRNPRVGGTFSISPSVSSRRGSATSTSTSSSAGSRTSSVAHSHTSSLNIVPEKSEWLPTNPGGGTVDMVIQGRHKYTNNILAREEAGTPNILATIRTGLVFTLQEIMRPEFVIQEEYRVTKKVLGKLLDPSLKGAINILGNPNVDRVAVFSLTIAVPPSLLGNVGAEEGKPPLQIHYALLSTIMNDFFGVEMRGGCMCAGPYASQLLKFDAEKELKFWNLLLGEGHDRAENEGHSQNHHTDENEHDETLSQEHSPKKKSNIHQHDLCSKSLKPGFVRFSFSYFAKDKDVDFVIQSLQWVAAYGYLLIPLYKINAISGEWSVRPAVQRAVLAEIAPKRLICASRENCIPVAVECIQALGRLYREQIAPQRLWSSTNAGENMSSANATTFSLSTMPQPPMSPIPSEHPQCPLGDLLQPPERPSSSLSHRLRRAAKISKSVKQARQSFVSAFTWGSSTDVSTSAAAAVVPSVVVVSESDDEIQRESAWPRSSGTSSSSPQDRHRRGQQSFMATPPSTPVPGASLSSSFKINKNSPLQQSKRPGLFSAARHIRPRDRQVLVEALQELTWEDLEQELDSIETSSLAKELRWFVTPLEVARVYEREAHLAVVNGEDYISIVFPK